MGWCISYYTGIAYLTDIGKKLPSNSLNKIILNISESLSLSSEYIFINLELTILQHVSQDCLKKLNEFGINTIQEYFKCEHALSFFLNQMKPRDAKQSLKDCIFSEICEQEIRYNIYRGMVTSQD